MDGYRALLIGNSTFPVDSQNLQDLNGPVKDVALLGGALIDRDVGLFDNDHVTLLVERTSAKIIEEIEAFLLNARRDDLLLLYYSGHGLLDERNRLYLAGTNTRIDRLRSTAVSAADISEMLDNSAARASVILLDCCHSGAFKGSFGPANLAGSGRYVLTSCRSGELANDADRRNGTSVFTQYLVDGLMGGAADLDGDGRVDLDEIYRYVHDRLAETDRQIPQRRFDGSARTPPLARRPRPVGPEAPPRSDPVGTVSPPPAVPDETTKGAPPPELQAVGREREPGRLAGARSRRLRRRFLIFAGIGVALLCLTVVFFATSDDPPARVLPVGPARLNRPRGIALDSAGNLYIADTGNYRVVRIEAGSRLATVVAGGPNAKAAAFGSPATDTALMDPSAVTVLPDGGFVIVDRDVGTGSKRLLKVDRDGKLRLVPLDAAYRDQFTEIQAVTADPAGMLYVSTGSRVLKLNPTNGETAVIAGTPSKGYRGDGGPATDAQLSLPVGLGVDKEAKNLYIADCENSRIRRVDLATHLITTFAGGGSGSYQEGGKATDMGGPSCPKAVAVGPDGAVYLVAAVQYIGKVADERITIAAGTTDEGATGAGNDGRPATETTLDQITGVAVDAQNRIYLTEGNRVRRVESDGRVSTYA